MPSLHRHQNVSEPAQGQRSRRAPAAARPGHQLRLAITGGEIGIGCRCDKYFLAQVRVPSGEIVREVYARHLAGLPQSDYSQPVTFNRPVDHKRR